MKDAILKDIICKAREANHAAIDFSKRPNLAGLARETRADRDYWMAEARKLKA